MAFLPNLNPNMSPSLLSETAITGLYRCIDVAGDGDDALRLKRLGVCAGRNVEVMRTGDPMVLNVIGTQIGVSRLAAQLVTVERVDSTISTATTEVSAAGVVSHG
jgi:Fe2+ transport system protein FeoA